MVTKTYCDVCGKEADVQSCAIYVKHGEDKILSTEYTDMCKDCLEKAIKKGEFNEIGNY